MTPTSEDFDPSSLQSESFGSPQQLVELMDAEVASGRVSREKADAMLRADGVEPPKREHETTSHLSPEEQLSQPEALTDEQLGLEPAKRPEDYRMPPFKQPWEELTQEDIAFDRTARGWLHAAGFPAALGSDVAREVARVDAQSQSMSDIEFSAYEAKETAQLRQQWGKDYDRRLGLARQLVAEIEAQSPGIVDLLNETGAGSSAAVIAQFAMQAERLHARSLARRRK